VIHHQNGTVANGFARDGSCCKPDQTGCRLRAPQWDSATVVPPCLCEEDPVPPECPTTPAPAPAPTTTTTSHPSGLCAKGLLNKNGRVCCPKKCGTCGGTDCEGRDGGEKKCCKKGANGQGILFTGEMCKSKKQTGCKMPTCNEMCGITCAYERGSKRNKCKDKCKKKCKEKREKCKGTCKEKCEDETGSKKKECKEMCKEDCEW